MASGTAASVKLYATGLESSPSKSNRCLLVGTFETCRRTLRMSGYQGRPEVGVVEIGDRDRHRPLMRSAWRHGAPHGPGAAGGGIGDEATRVHYACRRRGGCWRLAAAAVRRDAAARPIQTDDKA